MQQIDLNAAKAAKANDRRALAILAYDNAKAEPSAANWQGVADLLRLCIPAAKAKASAAEIAPDGAEAWADYVIPETATKRLGKSPVIVVTFACGAVVRAPAVSLPGKPINIGRGLRVAFAFYRARIAREYAGASVIGSDCVNVPAIVSAVCEATGAEYNASQCNEKTAAARLGGFDHIALVASAEALPVKSDCGDLIRGEFYRAHYLIAQAMRESAEANGETAAELSARIEDCGLRLSGMSQIEIATRRREIVKAARKAAEAEAKAERDAAHAAEIAEAERTAEAEAPRLALVASNAAPAEPVAVAAEAPAAEAEPAEIPAADSPWVAPSRAARFLASTSLGAPAARLPVAPSCILRVVA
jgi:hypothetical protein